MTERYIWHVTLDTGNTRRSPRSEVSDAILPGVRSMLKLALAGGQPQVMNGCTLTAAAEGRCLLGTVWAPVVTSSKPVPVVTIGVAEHSRCGRRLWQLMHDVAERTGMPPLATDRNNPPQEPWCAARIEIGSVAALETMEWLGDFERCLAWAWLERHTMH